MDCATQGAPGHGSTHRLAGTGLSGDATRPVRKSQRSLRYWLEGFWYSFHPPADPTATRFVEPHCLSAARFGLRLLEPAVCRRQKKPALPSRGNATGLFGYATGLAAERTD